jgi:hypothetical protein
MDRVIPHMMTYSDPKAPEAKRPKLFTEEFKQWRNLSRGI